MAWKALAALSLFVTLLQVRANVDCYEDPSCGQLSGAKPLPASSASACCLLNLTRPMTYAPTGDSSACLRCIVIGFDPNNLTIEEQPDAPKKQLRLKVLSDTTGLDPSVRNALLTATVQVNLTVSTANLSLDFKFNDGNESNTTFSENLPQLINGYKTINVQALNDNNTGEVEHFVVEVTRAQLYNREQGRTTEVFAGNSMLVNIIDDDIIHVGFEVSEFHLNEDMENLTINFTIPEAIPGATHFIVRPMTYKDYDDEYLNLSAKYPDLKPYTLTDEYDQAESKDFNPTEIHFTIPANSVRPNRSVTINVYDDDLLEPAEEGFRLLLEVDESQGTKRSEVIFKRQTALFRIDNTDKLIFGFGNDTLTVNDSDSKQDYQLPLRIVSGRTEINITLTFSTGDNTTAQEGESAGEGADFKSFGVVNITSPNKLDPDDFLDVTIYTDDIFEPQEFIQVSMDYELSLPKPFTPESVNDTSALQSVVDPPPKDSIVIDRKHTVIIIPAEPPEMDAYLIVPKVVQEGDTFFPIITVSHKVIATFRVYTEPNEGTAENVVDYSFTAQSLLFGPTNTMNTTNSPVDIVEDRLVEPNETFVVVFFLLSSPSDINDLVNLNPPNETITIVDTNDATIGFQQGSISVSENAGVAVLTVAVMGDQILAANAEVRVSLSTSTGTADESDFTPITDMELVFNGDHQVATVSISITDDNVYENTETLTAKLVLVDANVEVTLDPSQATISITNDDPLEIGFKAAAYRVNEGRESLTFEVEVKNSGQFAVPIGFTVTDMEGEALRMEDYSFSTVTLEFQLGQSIVQHSLSIVNDDVMEMIQETFTLKLQTSQPLVSVLTECGEAVVTIIDNDNITIGFENVMYFAPENTSVSVCVDISKGNLADNRDVTVMLQSMDLSATAPNDYEPVDEALVFTSQEVSSCVDVSVKGDITLEGHEVFILSLTSIDPSTILEPDEADVTIVQGDVPVVMVGFNRGNYLFNESDGLAVVDVVLKGQTTVNVTVSVQGGPSMQTMIGTDRVVFAEQNVTFTPDGLKEQTISTIIINDMVALEDDEIVTVDMNIVSPSTGVNFGPHKSTKVTIKDDDVVLVDFDKSKVGVNEGAGTVEICVQKNLQTIPDLEVDYKARDGTAFGHDSLFTSGSAFVGSDYVLVDPSVTLPANSLKACFDVVIVDDSEYEGMNESFFLDLVKPNEASLTSPSTVEVEIIDNDPRPEKDCILSSSLILQTFTSENGNGPNLNISEGCEHQLVTACNDTLDLEIRVDFLKDNFSSTKVAILYNGATVTIEEDLSLDPDSSPNDEIDYHKIMDKTSVSIEEISLTVSRTPTEVTISTTNNSLLLAGLCGSLDGMLYFPKCRKTASEDSLQLFKDAYKLKPSDQMLRGERTECGLTASDTVVGDPLMTVPIYAPGFPEHAYDLHLCYEIHGAADEYFNFVSDSCTSVNAHYVQAPEATQLNIIDSMSFVVIDNQGACQRISVDVLNCSTTVNGDTLISMSKKRAIMSPYEKNGISVRSYTSRVRISVPNCADNSLVMWVICQRQPIQIPFTEMKTSPVDMIKFEITRGLNLKETSHGLIGQFWNIPVDVVPYLGTFNGDLGSNNSYYTVNVAHPQSETRSFIGFLYELSWEFESKQCLYVGNNQGGPIGEVIDPNDSVIEGVYADYITADAFETDFKYGVFKSQVC